MSQQSGSNPDPEPKDATKVTEEQREMQDKLDHQGGGDPDGPGQQQSRHNTAGESTR